MFIYLPVLNNNSLYILLLVKKAVMVIRKQITQKCALCARTRKLFFTDRKGTVFDPVEVQAYWELGEETNKKCSLHDWREEV